tara:strand:+ start:2753 stop:2935 length:183 start_codon:yes stop_codon:yes gene_type:complete
MSSGTFKFDKFIDDITKREESRQASEKKVEETGTRKYNRLYRELWQNRVVWSSKKQETKK